MKKIILLLMLVVGASQAGFAQFNFSKLSGKAKSKAAEKEEQEAKKDDVYQGLMKEGHEHFSNNEFDEAIKKYESAADRRPINVYPKVKIADVQLAMMNYVEEAPAPEIVEEPISADVDTDPNQEDRISDMLQKEEQKIKDSLPPAPKEIYEDVVEPPVLTNLNEDHTKENIKVLTKEEFAASLAADYKDGVTEEVFEEGNKKITRRVVVKNGKGTDYRKVVHNWGGIYFFKNDETISKHTWDTETVIK